MKTSIQNLIFDFSLSILGKCCWIINISFYMHSIILLISIYDENFI